MLKETEVKKRLNIRLDEADHRRLRVLAALSGESIQALVVRLLRQAVEAEEKQQAG